ncbi:MAG: DegT/DnrJ/EryC1/StrS family aminotransferase [Spirochaetes bacterium]|nr:DegT/DnrJ/EryC1/StrS family aminotransferase [Spirochaetota bacterium]
MIPHSRPTIQKKDLEEALNVLVSDKLATGNVVYEFERAFANYFGKGFSAVFVTSGTAALELIMEQMGIGEGDEVILSSFLNVSPLQVITARKAKPVLVDIGEDTFNMDMDMVLERITERTKAVIVSHMFGSVALIDELAEAKVPLIEDCGHALGARFKGLPAGSFSDYAYFSLAATRMITSGGAGGMILTRKKGIEELRDIRHYDKKDDFKKRYNFYPTDLQAAVGLSEMRELDKDNPIRNKGLLQIRREIAEIYNTSLMQAKASKPIVHDTEIPNNYRYVIRLDGEMTVPEVIEMFGRQDVEVARPVYKPLHHYLSLPREEFPNTETAYLRAVSIPIYPALLKKQVELIAKLIKRIR